jgi:hypothetical protein
MVFQYIYVHETLIYALICFQMFKACIILKAIQYNILSIVESCKHNEFFNLHEVIKCVLLHSKLCDIEFQHINLIIFLNLISCKCTQITIINW